MKIIIDVSVKQLNILRSIIQLEWTNAQEKERKFTTVGIHTMDKEYIDNLSEILKQFN